MFEFECDVSARSRGFGGGGRYDGLIEATRRLAHTWLWWALGVDRIALALEQQEDAARARPGGKRDGCSSRRGGSAGGALALVTELRPAGIRADLDLAGRAIKGR